MAWLLVQLKIRLLANALRSSTTAKASFVVSTIFAVLFAIAMFFVLAVLRGNGAAVDLTAVIFTLVAFGWLILPIMVFGLDGTLDPATLALYPLRTRPLATGLIAASVAGAWPLANVVGLLGVTVGLARGPAGVLVAIVAVLLEVLFCITIARLVTTSMAGLLRSRRGKDLAAFLIIPIFVLYEFFTQVVPRVAAEGTLTARSFTGIDSWLRWLPPGLAAHAIADASNGRFGTAVARLALLAAVTVVLGWLWIRALSRALVTTDTSGQSGKVRAAALPAAPFGVAGAITARFWIYQRRDPTALVYWALTAVIMAAVSASSIAGHHKVSGVIIASAIFGAAFVGYFHANPVGLTGSPFILEALALPDRRSLRAYFAGQDVALAVIAVPLLVAISFALAAVIGKPATGVTAAAVALAGLGGALALSNVLGVLAPFPMVSRAGTPMRQAAPGYYGVAGGSVLGSLLGTAALSVPAILAGVLTTGDPAAVRAPVLLIAAAAYGLVVAWAGVRIAASAAVGRLPELCQIALRSAF